MTIELAHCPLDEAKGLAEFYNEQIGGMPYAHPVSAEEFDWGIRHREYEGEFSYTELSDEVVIVARRTGRVVRRALLGDLLLPICHRLEAGSSYKLR